MDRIAFELLTIRVAFDAIQQTEKAILKLWEQGKTKGLEGKNLESFVTKNMIHEDADLVGEAFSNLKRKRKL